MNPALQGFVEVKLKHDDDFLKVKETLTRIGVASDRTKTLYQSCHILHKRGLYYIVHFKEMFALDGKPSTMDEYDRKRRNLIAKLLQDWGLLTLVDKSLVSDLAPMSDVRIVAFRDKPNWTLTPKYQIGQTNR